LSFFSFFYCVPLFFPSCLFIPFFSR